MTEQTRQRVAELVAQAPPISAEQRELVLRIMGSALRRDPDQTVGIHPRPRRTAA